jgi:hypothetical protein
LTPVTTLATSSQGQIVRNFRRKFRVFQKAAGESWNPLATKLPTDIRTVLITFAKFRNVGQTAENMGYQDLDFAKSFRKQKDLEAYWSLIPEKIK